MSEPRGAARVSHVRRGKNYRARNREKICAWSRDYYNRNKDAMRKYGRERYARLREKEKEEIVMTDDVRELYEMIMSEIR